MQLISILQVAVLVASRCASASPIIPSDIQFPVAQPTNDPIAGPSEPLSPGVQASTISAGPVVPTLHANPNPVNPTELLVPTVQSSAIQLEPPVPTLQASTVSPILFKSVVPSSQPTNDPIAISSDPPVTTTDSPITTTDSPLTAAPITDSPITTTDSPIATTPLSTISPIPFKSVVPNSQSTNDPIVVPSDSPIPDY